MLATLVIPSSEGISHAYGLQMKFCNGKPVLFSSHGHSIDGHYFQFLRDRMGAMIETNDIPVVAGLLGVPITEPGLLTTN